MELLKITTELLSLKDPNIKILFVLKYQTHIEMRAKLDFKPPLCPHCPGNMIKYDFQKPSKIPILDCQGFPCVLSLKKRRFQCKNCSKVTVSETPLVLKNHQISQPVPFKMTQLLTNSMTNFDIASTLHVSLSIVQRKLAQFTFKEDFSSLPEVISWDELSRNKGKLAFIVQDFDTRKIITILDNNRQSTIKNYFYRYTRKVREHVKVVTVDMSESYIPIIKQLFPKAKIVLNRFHVIQHLSRAIMTTRIALMKSFDKKSQTYRLLKYHWRFFQKDSRKLSEESFYCRTLAQTVTPREVIYKALSHCEELRYYYNLYQLLLFHFQEKRIDAFFSLIEENLTVTNKILKTVFKTFIKHKTSITNALETSYSNAKLEATNKLIKDIKRAAFGFQNFENFKNRILIALNLKKESINLILSRT
ncbi:ISL3 family transposase [Streptococcus uberis]|uniref:ISL3 family transposase n=1 Tax=Streptococcus uberis TaxID=1349 RepID=UPI0038D3C1D1